MKLTFLGATGTVTGSKYLVETGRDEGPGRLRPLPGRQAAATAQLGAAPRCRSKNSTP